MTEEKIFDLIVDRVGTRLDKFVAEACPDISRTRIQKLIESGHITVNGEIVKSGCRLEKGQQIKVVIPAPAPSKMLAEDIPLNILYEDNDLLVVDKPAGMTVHPGAGNHDHTLANAVLSHVPEMDTEDTERPGIVHRLDKNTSGLIIVAKNPTAHTNLSEQFQNRQVVKVYITLVKGYLTPESGTLKPISVEIPNTASAWPWLAAEGRPPQLIK